MAGGSAKPGSFDDIFDLIAEIRDRLKDQKLTEKQRAEIEALLAYYLGITEQLKAQINYSLTPGDSLTPDDGPLPVAGFSLTPGDNPKK